MGGEPGMAYIAAQKGENEQALQLLSTMRSNAQTGCLIFGFQGSDMFGNAALCLARTNCE